MSGYYSLAQYMPHPRRHEGVNVGVMLLDREQKIFDAQVTFPIPRIHALQPGVAPVVITDIIETFYKQTQEAAIQDLDGLTQFVLGRKHVIRCTEPEWIEIDDFQGTLTSLLTRLVR